MESKQELRHSLPETEEAKQIEQLNEPKKKAKLLPKKYTFRQRAHLNPFNDTPFPYFINFSPLNPDYINLKIHYPIIFGGEEENQEIAVNSQIQQQILFFLAKEYPMNFDNLIDNSLNGKSGKSISFVDVGCGYGGLLFALSYQYPEELSFGIEIRDKLVNYVGEKIKGMRVQNPGKVILSTNNLQNVVQQYCCSEKQCYATFDQFFSQGISKDILISYFIKIQKLFFCFPDPNFKKKTIRRRIINFQFLSEYAYLLKPKGRIYCITDVEQLHEWHIQHLDAHPQFSKLSEEDLKNDPCIELIYNSTEEGIRVQKNKGNKFSCVYEKNDN